MWSWRAPPSWGRHGRARPGHAAAGRRWLGAVPLGAVPADGGVRLGPGRGCDRAWSGSGAALLSSVNIIGGFSWRLALGTTRVSTTAKIPQNVAAVRGSRGIAAARLGECGTPILRGQLRLHAQAPRPPAAASPDQPAKCAPGTPGRHARLPQFRLRAVGSVISPTAPVAMPAPRLTASAKGTW